MVGGNDGRAGCGGHGWHEGRAGRRGGASGEVWAAFVVVSTVAADVFGGGS